MIIISRIDIKDNFVIKGINTVGIRKIGVPIIFCGGAGSKEDFSKLVKETDIDAVAAANIFHFSDQSLYYIKKHLFESNLNFREPKIFEI